MVTGKRDMTVQTVTPVMFCEGRATNKNHVYMQRNECGKLTYTNPEDTVLDCCMGSGSIGVACLQNARKYIGMENDLAIFEVAKSRLEGAK